MLGAAGVCRARSDAVSGPAGVFVYPLAEAEVVSGFEAEAAGRRVSFQLQSRRRSQPACCRALGPALGASTPRRCAQGESSAATPRSSCRPAAAQIPAPALPALSLPPIDSSLHSTVVDCIPGPPPGAGDT